MQQALNLYPESQEKRKERQTHFAESALAWSSGTGNFLSRYFIYDNYNVPRYIPSLPNLLYILGSAASLISMQF